MFHNYVRFNELKYMKKILNIITIGPDKKRRVPFPSGIKPQPKQVTKSKTVEKVTVEKPSNFPNPFPFSSYTDSCILEYDKTSPDVTYSPDFHFLSLTSRLEPISFRIFSYFPDKKKKPTLKITGNLRRTKAQKMAVSTLPQF